MDDSWNNSSSNNNNNKAKQSGVADYFAILGVGDHLVWKHTQKEQQLYDDEDPLSANNNITATTEHHDVKTKDENDANTDRLEEQERFLREIVDVTIVGVQQHQQKLSQPTTDVYVVGTSQVGVSSSTRTTTRSAAGGPVVMDFGEQHSITSRMSGSTQQPGIEQV